MSDVFRASQQLPATSKSSGSNGFCRLARVALRHAINEAALSDEAAAKRNRALLSDVSSAISILQTVQKKAATARVSAKHAEARLKQEAELAALRSELGEVQRRREKARATSRRSWLPRRRRHRPSNCSRQSVSWNALTALSARPFGSA